jgi:hypothetical protein
MLGDKVKNDHLTSCWLAHTYKVKGGIDPTFFPLTVHKSDFKSLVLHYFTHCECSQLKKLKHNNNGVVVMKA